MHCDALAFAEIVDSLVHAEFTSLVEIDESSVGSPGVSIVRRSESGIGQGDPFDLDKARLYVVPSVDDGSDVDIVLLDEDENPYRLLRRTRHHLPIRAGCLVATGWCAPFGLDDDAHATPPSCHPLRQRVRLSVAVTDAGIASVIRQSDRPDVVHSLPSRGIGDLPDVLDVWWRGG